MFITNTLSKFYLELLHTQKYADKPFAEVQGNIFDSTGIKLKTIKMETITSIADIIFRSFKQSTANYFKKRYKLILN